MTAFNNSSGAVQMILVALNHFSLEKIIVLQYFNIHTSDSLNNKTKRKHKKKVKISLHTMIILLSISSDHVTQFP